MSVEGEVKFYAQTADDGATISRGFCPHCGSPLLGESTGHTDVLIIAAGSLDEPALFKPQKVVFGGSGQPWDYVDPALPMA